MLRIFCFIPKSVTIVATGQFDNSSFVNMPILSLYISQNTTLMDQRVENMYITTCIKKV